MPPAKDKDTHDASVLVVEGAPHAAAAGCSCAPCLCVRQTARLAACGDAAQSRHACLRLLRPRSPRGGQAHAGWLWAGEEALPFPSEVRRADPADLCLAYAGIWTWRIAEVATVSARRFHLRLHYRALIRVTSVPASGELSPEGDATQYTVEAALAAGAVHAKHGDQHLTSRKGVADAIRAFLAADEAVLTGGTVAWESAHLGHLALGAEAGSATWHYREHSFDVRVEDPEGRAMPWATRHVEAWIEEEPWLRSIPCEALRTGVWTEVGEKCREEKLAVRWRRHGASGARDAGSTAWSLFLPHQAPAT